MAKIKKIYEIKMIKPETENDVNWCWMGSCVANDINPILKRAKVV